MIKKHEFDLAVERLKLAEINYKKAISCFNFVQEDEYSPDEDMHGAWEDLKIMNSKYRKSKIDYKKAELAAVGEKNEH